MIAYDDSQLQRMFSELEPKRRLQALKGAFRKEANKVRKAAIGYLKSSIRTDRDLASGIRAKVHKRSAGFTVTVGTKTDKKQGKSYGFHTNRRGLKKPVLIWAEDGTEQRETKTKSKFCLRKRKGHPTGRMNAYRFMLRAKVSTKDEITNDLHNEIRDNVKRIAEKYGCKS